MKPLVLAISGYLILCAQPVGAAKPEAGGSNQVNAVEGRTNETLFNGEVRVRLTNTRYATAEENDAIGPADNQRVMVVEATMSNGTRQPFNGVFEYSLADADGTIIAGESRYVEPNPPPEAPPGGAWREKVSFIAPKTFAPRKLVIVQTVKTNQNDVAKAFRIAIDPSALH